MATGTLADLKAALITQPPDSVLAVNLPPDRVVTLPASQLQSALGVTYSPPVTIAYQAIVNSSVGLNLRAGPSKTALILETLVNGATVDVIAPATPIVVGAYSWLNVLAHDGKKGYVASQYLNRVIVPPTPLAHRLGLSVFFDGRSKVQEFIARGARLKCAVVIADAGYANDLAQTVEFTIYRHQPDTTPTIPADDTQAEAAGRQFVRDQFAADNDLGALDDQVYVQIANEIKFVPGLGAWWLGVAKELTAMGRKAALFAFGVGQPEVAEWQQLTPVLTFAKANESLVVLHCYAAPDAQPGQLSPETERIFWEFRFLSLYTSVPETAHPTLIVGELARENSRGKYEGVDNLLSFTKMFDSMAAASLPEYEGSCLWTVGSGGGKWPDSDIQSALPDNRVLALYQ